MKVRLRTLVIQVVMTGQTIVVIVIGGEWRGEGRQ